MRLRTISIPLYDYIRKEHDRAVIFHRIFCCSRLEVISRIQSVGSAPDLPDFLFEKHLAANNEYNAMSLYFDEKYFYFSEGKEYLISKIYLSLARLSAALAFFFEGASPDSICEAIYESIMATSNPQENASEWSKKLGIN